MNAKKMKTTGLAVLLAASATIATPSFAAGRDADRGAKGTNLYAAYESAGEGLTAIETRDGETLYIGSTSLLASGATFAGTFTAEGSDGVVLSGTRSELQPGDLVVAVRGGGHVATLSVETVDARTGQVTLRGASAGTTDLNLADSAAAVIEFVPVQTSVRAGRSVRVDVFVAGVENLRAYQITPQVSASDSVELGFASGRIDENRADYVFAGRQTIAAFDTEGWRFGSIMYEGGVRADERAYVGSFELTTSPDASGSYLIGANVDASTFLADLNSAAIDYRVAFGTVNVSAPKADTSIR